uniref:Uncharacterized protein n=1 Tax=Aureoumbra lagunensis TaxID=44058 RepID=A0A7S3K5W3_9STRA|mmetsp:Transcript_12849/g.17222  ORF Transcript_12849/g.17222 Transcript_12849/m.17222 type:complete len:495 (+) Transcript_12849:62-1546(+)
MPSGRKQAVHRSWIDEDEVAALEKTMNGLDGHGGEEMQEEKNHEEIEKEEVEMDDDEEFEEASAMEVDEMISLPHRTKDDDGNLKDRFSSNALLLSHVDERRDDQEEFDDDEVSKDDKERFYAPISNASKLAADASSSIQDVPISDEWRTVGSEYINKKVRRKVSAPDDNDVLWVQGVVIGWLPASESEFVDDNGKPAALYRIKYTAGWKELRNDVEDLELHELRESFLEENASDIIDDDGKVILSEYEKLREQNIERNKSILASLGLGTTTKSGGRPPGSRSPSKKRKTEQSPIAVSGRRTSARITKIQEAQARKNLEQEKEAENIRRKKEHSAAIDQKVKKISLQVEDLNDNGTQQFKRPDTSVQRILDDEDESDVEDDEASELAEELEDIYKKESPQHAFGNYESTRFEQQEKRSKAHSHLFEEPDLPDQDNILEEFGLSRDQVIDISAPSPEDILGILAKYQTPKNEEPVASLSGLGVSGKLKQSYYSTS